MKSMNIKKPIEGFITNEEGAIAQKRAVNFLNKLKAAETTKGKTTFTGTVNGKFTQVTIRGEGAEERFFSLCKEKSWDFSGFTKV